MRGGSKRDFQDCSQFGQQHTISITRMVQPEEILRILSCVSPSIATLKNEKKQQGTSDHKGDRYSFYKDNTIQPVTI